MSLDEPQAHEPPDEAPSNEIWIDPLYLFRCGLSWRNQHYASAGWELVHCLRSPGQTAKIAAAMLAQTENPQAPVSERIRVIDTLRMPPMSSAPAVSTSRKRRRG